MPSNDAGCRWWWWRFGGETLSSQPWQRAAQPRQTFFPQLLLAAASECTNPNLSPGSPSEQYKVLHFLLLASTHNLVGLSTRRGTTGNGRKGGRCLELSNPERGHCLFAHFPTSRGSDVWFWSVSHCFRNRSHTNYTWKTRKFCLDFIDDTKVLQRVKRDLSLRDGRQTLGLWRESKLGWLESEAKKHTQKKRNIRRVWQVWWQREREGTMF